MQYIWEVVLAAEKNGIREADLQYEVPEVRSPYKLLINSNILALKTFHSRICKSFLRICHDISSFMGYSIVRWCN